MILSNRYKSERFRALHTSNATPGTMDYSPENEVAKKPLKDTSKGPAIIKMLAWQFGQWSNSEPWV